eukprot:CAMPEP_0115027382 /NCGR_PEP_ID=MMETSP0216-20121206/35470_1 /TAXON_ID=223996 /ORGANISM="Protocruzia adherens, Strain Boccale" /LENGTH=1125 /DNA_ID=CAMNT_0002402961 /DNA_START=28 /DNA_END=3405 /DNA_ORIENTATION=-
MAGSKGSRRSLLFEYDYTESEVHERKVVAKEEHQELYPSNKISTTKYNWFTFIPKNLLEQFRKLPNVYFLIIAVMQTLPPITISQGKPVILLPLAFVLAVSAIKDMIEDLKRKKSDNEENEKTCQVVVGQGLTTKLWQEVEVGDIVRIKKKEFFPADLLVIHSSDPDNVCYVETKNLDGETNLKHKSIPRQISSHIQSEAAVRSYNGTFLAERPNEKLHTFHGYAYLPDVEQTPYNKIPLTLEHLLIRGSSLRQTDYIYGVVLYTGHQTKIMLNSISARPKMSRIERTMNRQIVYIVLIQFFLCAFAALVFTVWVRKDGQKASYLGWDESSSQETSNAYLFFSVLGTWVLIFTNFVPISLLVTLEVVKFCQAMFISFDKQIYHRENKLPTKVHSSNLNEELGQVNYVFSDKTGTLTCNVMAFKKISVMGNSFGHSSLGDTGDQEYRQGISNVAFYDPDLDNILMNPSNRNYNEVVFFLHALSLCHTVLLHHDEAHHDAEYQASSPDELALVNGAKYLGLEFMGLDREGNMNLQNHLNGKKEQWQLLNVLEFTNERRRMSVIVRSPDDRIILFCKGADSMIFPRLKHECAQLMKETLEHLEEFGQEGLRTLGVAYKIIEPEAYIEWSKAYQAAATSIDRRAEMVYEVSESIEKELILLGATAIEDKLQVGVNATLTALKSVGIKVWILTGDKQSTAINIAFSCELLTNEMEHFILDTEDDSKISRTLNRLNLKDGPHQALVITGTSLSHVLRSQSSREMFIEKVKHVAVLIICRVSPIQKAQVVKAVREQLPKMVTLAIGDGANDVNMITEAHIGVGISGLEGKQAARAGDYAIGQFSFLKRLMFVHGREAYRRNSMLVCYNFYKNVVFVIPQLWFGAFNFFSGQTLYDPWLYQLYNIFYTSLPIFLYSIFDRGTENLDQLERFTDMYLPGIERKAFNTKVFWKWFFYGFLQAGIIMFFCFLPLQVTNEADGHMDGLWVGGSSVFTAVVVIVNLKVLHFTKSFFIFTYVAVFGSIASYFITFALFSMIPNLPVTGIFSEVIGDKTTYLVLGLVLATSTPLDHLLVQSRDVQVPPRIKKRTRLSEDPIDLSQISLSTPRHTGYSFSQEPGKTPSVIEMTSSARDIFA